MRAVAQESALFFQPPNDPRGIRKEDLVIGLRNVFASSSKFADFALPLLLEKLQSTVISSKVDSLHTLVSSVFPWFHFRFHFRSAPIDVNVLSFQAACAEVYGPKALAEYTNSFWSCIKREVKTLVSFVLTPISHLVRCHEVFSSAVFPPRLGVHTGV